LDYMGFSGTLVFRCYESLADHPREERQHTCHRRARDDWWTARQALEQRNSASDRVYLLGTKIPGWGETRERRPPGDRG
jgi:hypothetical protein